MPRYPIGFSIHSSKIVTNLGKKTKLCAFIKPGDTSTYIYKTEAEYYKDYSESLFGITKCKGGWDCMRHYEILANGCIPYFENLQNCPNNTLTFLPKELIKKAMSLYDDMKKEERPLENEYNMKLYYKYAEELLEHTRKYLTNYSMASYVLTTCNVVLSSNNLRILYLSGSIYPDYLRCTLLVGMKEILGDRCHDYPCIPHIYTNVQNSENLYGRGISYTKILDKSKYRNNDYDSTINEDIQKTNYDFVVYGSLHRGLPFFDEVKKYYKNNRILILCGEDLHVCNEKFSNDDHSVFIREY